MTLEEGANVEYIRLHCAFTRKGCTYIVMEYIHGQTLWEYWQRASEKSKEIIRRQLISLMHDLRSVPNPVPGQVSGLIGGPIYDYRYTDGIKRSFGPLSNVHDFHLWLRYGLTSPFSPERSSSPDRS